MKSRFRFPLFPFICFVFCTIVAPQVFSQTEADRTPVIVEAEDGDVGGDVDVLTDDDITYVTVATNSTGSSPEAFDRTVIYDVTFPAAGSYDLYVRLRVGTGGFDDDSFFYGNGFGEKNVASSSDWILVNGVATGGFTEASDVIDGPGPMGSNVWKWLNLTKNGYQSAVGDPFIVDQAGATRTFQIGGREDGLNFDKFAFGRSDLFFTVEMLDNGLPGSPTNPDDDTTGVVWEGPALASGSSKFLGCGYDGADPEFINYWTQLTPGNAGKFGSVARTENSAQWNWAPLDQAYAFAKDNNLVFKNHCLVWGQQQPGWITESGLDSAEQADAIDEWIFLVGDRYPDMDMVDVVNEPLLSHNPAPYREALGGAGETGWDWVIWAFEKAREYMPDTQLLLNDYGIINDDNATSAYLEIINLLQARGLIDGIGVQGHRFELERANINTLKRNLDRLAETGLPIYISELDLGNLSNAGTPDDQQQLDLYQKIFPVLWEHPGVKGITIWGYREGEVWQSSTYLVRYNGTARPALLWLADYLENETAVEAPASGLPTAFQLEQNFPNPFNPMTTIRYSIATPSTVTLQLFDITGRQVKTLVDQHKQPGQYAVSLYADELPSGMYVYRLQAGTFTSTKKLLLIR